MATNRHRVGAAGIRVFVPIATVITRVVERRVVAVVVTGAAERVRRIARARDIRIDGGVVVVAVATAVATSRMATVASVNVVALRLVLVEQSEPETEPATPESADERRGWRDQRVLCQIIFPVKVIARCDKFEQRRACVVMQCMRRDSGGDARPPVAASAARRKRHARERSVAQLRCARLPATRAAPHALVAELAEHQNTLTFPFAPLAPRARPEQELNVPEQPHVVHVAHATRDVAQRARVAAREAREHGAEPNREHAQHEPPAKHAVRVTVALAARRVKDEPLFFDDARRRVRLSRSHVFLS